MKTRTTLADEMTLRSLFGSLANQAVRNLTGVALASTVVTTRDQKVLPGFVTTPPLRRPTNTVIIGVLLATLLFARPGSAQFIQNPSFEGVQIGSPGNPFSNSSTNLADIPGWEHKGDIGDGLLWNTAYPSTGVAGEGKQFVTMGGGDKATGNASIWRTTIFGLSPGQKYRLGFKIANEGEPASQTMGAQVSFGTGASGGAARTYTTTCGSGQYFWQCWEQEYLLFTAVDHRATLDFFVVQQQYNMGLDDITIKEVPQTGGTWTPICPPPSTLPCTPFPGSGAGAALLLTDGRVLVYTDTNAPTQTDGGDWYTLTPNQFGDYAKGTWAKVASLTKLGSYCYAPHAFASAVLPDGRVIVEGGEFNAPQGGCAFENNTNKGAIYDPTSDKWSSVAPPPGWATIGDAQSVVLPNGTFMLANAQTSQQAEMTAPYSGGSSWVSTGAFKHTRNDEEGWTLLPGPPDAEVLLTVNTSSGTCPPDNNSEVYINGFWLCSGKTPTQLWEGTPTGGPHEVGPSVLRPDSTVFQAGGTTMNGSGESAIFDTSTFQWTAGPKFPNNSQSHPLAIADGPAALLPNGNVLMMASSPAFPNDGAVFFELQYLTNNLAPVTAPAPPNTSKDVSMNGHMLVLPTGQIWFSDFSKDVEIYTPDETAADELWRPVVQHINGSAAENCFSSGLFVDPYDPFPPNPCTIHRTSPNTVDGLQLNGMSQGAAYGDDYQSATNYPLVSITEALPICFIFNGVGSCPTPHVYYCRTHDHSNMGVATGNLLVSTKFECPNVPTNFRGYLAVVANGIPGGFVPVIVQ